MRCVSELRVSRLTSPDDPRWASAVETQALAFGSRLEAGHHMRLLRCRYDDDPELWQAVADIDLRCALEPGCHILVLADADEIVVAVACVKDAIPDEAARSAAFEHRFAPFRDRVQPEALAEYDRALRGRTAELCVRAFGCASPEDGREVSWLAVRPDRQGQGVGSRLLAELIDQSRADGRLLYLITSPELHVRFYVRSGFQVRAGIWAAPDMHTRLLVAW